MPSAETTDAPKGLLDRSKLDLTLSEKCELIDATQWTTAFSYEQIKQLSRFMDVYTVEKGAELFREGEKSPYLVLIAAGRIDVIKEDSNLVPKKVTTLGPGKTIGEMSIIDGEPRSASAVAASEAMLLVMTENTFNELKHALPGITVSLVLKIAKQMSQYLRQTSGRPIDHLGP